MTPAIEAGPAATPPAGGGAEEGAIVPVAAEEAVPEGMIKAKEHPRYKKFFKLMDMHIPAAAIRIKMQAEEPDLDPGILDAPDAGEQLIPE